MNTRKGSRGVTLVELCVGLAVLAILASMGAPSFRASLRAAAVRTATYELLAGLQQARGHSIVEARPALFCPSDPADNCLPAAAPAQAWRSSTEGAASASFDRHALPAGVRVRSSRSPLRFWPDSLSASTGTLTICDVQGIAAPRAIVLSQSGRARIGTALPAACG
jgi:type IV fimbrial biogenesis protein FimT